MMPEFVQIFPPVHIDTGALDCLECGGKLFYLGSRNVIMTDSSQRTEDVYQCCWCRRTFKCIALTPDKETGINFRR